MVKCGNCCNFESEDASGVGICSKDNREVNVFDTCQEQDENRALKDKIVDAFYRVTKDRMTNENLKEALAEFETDIELWM